MSSDIFFYLSYFKKIIFNLINDKKGFEKMTSLLKEEKLKIIKWERRKTQCKQINQLKRSF